MYLQIADYLELLYLQIVDYLEVQYLQIVAYLEVQYLQIVAYLEGLYLQIASPLKNYPIICVTTTVEQSGVVVSRVSYFITYFRKGGGCQDRPHAAEKKISRWVWYVGFCRLGLVGWDL